MPLRADYIGSPPTRGYEDFTVRRRHTRLDALVQWHHDSVQDRDNLVQARDDLAGRHLYRAVPIALSVIGASFSIAQPFTSLSSCLSLVSRCAWAICPRNLTLQGLSAGVQRLSSEAVNEFRQCPKLFVSIPSALCLAPLAYNLVQAVRDMRQAALRVINLNNETRIADEWLREEKEEIGREAARDPELVEFEEAAEEQWRSDLDYWAATLHSSQQD